jgi:hypothetical protein
VQFPAGRFVVGILLCAVMAAPVCAQKIYTCIDSKGRKLTADRPIIDCLDREQKELSPGGIVVRKIGPSLTADERAAEEVKAAKALEERNRLEEEKKRDRALLTRYPDRAAHDKERAASLTLIDNVIAAAHKHSADLVEQRKRLDTELEFYQGDVSKAPPKIKRQVDEIQQQLEFQKRFVANQEAEKKRLNARYDDELVKLKQLWAKAALPTTAAASAASAIKKR